MTWIGLYVLIWFLAVIGVVTAVVVAVVLMAMGLCRRIRRPAEAALERP